MTGPSGSSSGKGGDGLNPNFGPQSSGNGGAGGGGYGGGGGGGPDNPDENARGGGGGGSFAAQSSLPFAAAPGSEAADGWIGFVFNIPAATPAGTFNCSDRPSENLTVTVLTNGGYNLLWQDDGNLVLYNPANVPVWASNTSNTGTALCFQTDGNLVIYNADGSPVFTSSTADAEHGGAGGQWLTLYQDGTLEIVNGSGVVLWTAS